MKNTQNAQSVRIGDAAYEALLAQEALILDAQIAIQRVLNEKGISQRQLSRILDVSESYVSQMLGDSARNLTLKTIARIMHALGETAILTTYSYVKGFEEPTAPFECDAEFGPWGEIVTLESGQNVGQRAKFAAHEWASNENLRSPAELADAA